MKQFPHTASNMEAREQLKVENIADYPSNRVHELLPNNIDPAKIETFKKFYEV